MTPEQKNEITTRLVVAASSIILTILGANVSVVSELTNKNDARAAEIDFHFKEIADQNHALLLKIEALTVENLPEQTRSGHANEKLNASILKKIDALQAEIDLLKRR